MSWRAEMIKTLISIRLRAFVGRTLSSGKTDGRRHGKGRVVLFSVLFLYLFAAFAFLSTMMAVFRAVCLDNLRLCVSL